MFKQLITAIMMAVIGWTLLIAGASADASAMKFKREPDMAGPPDPPPFFEHPLP